MDMSRFVKYFCIVLLLLPIGLKGQANKSDLEKRKKALQEEIRQTSQLILETRKNKTASLSQLKALNKKLADRMRFPSGENATELIRSECPRNIRITRPVAMSHSRSA
jgi:hypothetical protein